MLLGTDKELAAALKIIMTDNVYDVTNDNVHAHLPKLFEN
jgi:hypothetical protein